MKVKMLNIDGEVLYLTKFSTREVDSKPHFNHNFLKKLKKGIYFLHYDLNNDHFTKKVVID